MSLSRRNISSQALALALVLPAAPALADVTPTQVWEGFRDYLESSGYSVTADVTEAGGTLTAGGLEAVITFPEDEGTLTFAGGDIRFEDLGDGTVRVAFPERMPIRITGMEAEEEVAVDLAYTHRGLDMVVSGDESAMLYDYSAEALSIALEELRVDGVAMPPEVGSGGFTLEGVSGDMRMGSGPVMELAQTVNAESASYEMAITDPDTGEKVDLAGRMQDLSLTGEGMLPELSEGMSGADMIAEGLEVAGSFTYAGGETRMSGVSEGAPFEFTSASGGGNIEVALSEEGLGYQFGADALEISVTSAEMPLPISATASEARFGIAMPVTASEEPQDVDMMLRFVGFEVTEMLWSIFDPAGNLPRDPASVVLDVTGKVTPYLSLLDPAAMEAAESAGEVPGELNAVTINELRVEAVGAELTGEGAFSFDNSDLETFGGMPAPSGEAVLRLSGANALIDTLVEMGFVSAEDAMGARMMLSMFAVPGEGPDSLTSTISVTEDGQVSANGQRIR
ncbi:DUF2125 domain-containing protein [Roseivivax sp. GX 12232]|uniref:DUF2125 domain-containing protein n=1 Tax=Roseivivax sp. GX 12232 TaxID=2900547 RepID=UPI001E53AC20|nr:DUF2125 domain-containing protein [Roseivivax sp. GX 12232]MCE0507119.1 DUF2125 domain-containing protein [Roseivivax sp. GX 12232]